MDDFVVDDDSDAPINPKKRKRPASTSSKLPNKRVSSSPSGPAVFSDDEPIPTTSTAQQWRFDPDAEPSSLPIRTVHASKPSKPVRKLIYGSSHADSCRYTRMANRRKNRLTKLSQTQGIRGWRISLTSTATLQRVLTTIPEQYIFRQWHGTSSRHSKSNTGRSSRNFGILSSFSRRESSMSFTKKTPRSAHNYSTSR